VDDFRLRTRTIDSGHTVTDVIYGGQVIDSRIGRLTEDQAAFIVLRHREPLTSIGRREDDWKYLNGARPGRKPKGYVYIHEEEL
jgi:hypothetical protein